MWQHHTALASTISFQLTPSPRKSGPDDPWDRFQPGVLGFLHSHLSLSGHSSAKGQASVTAAWSHSNLCGQAVCKHCHKGLHNAPISFWDINAVCKNSLANSVWRGGVCAEVPSQMVRTAERCLARSVLRYQTASTTLS